MSSRYGPRARAHQQAVNTILQEKTVTFALDDIETIEGDDAPIDDVAVSIQRAINSGLWGLQGSYGRQMMDFIEAGLCMLGQHPARDYYGNHIPSRSQVQEGTKGSRGYVVGARGEEWAAMLDRA